MTNKFLQKYSGWFGLPVAFFIAVWFQDWRHWPLIMAAVALPILIFVISTGFVQLKGFALDSFDDYYQRLRLAPVVVPAIFGFGVLLALADILPGTWGWYDGLILIGLLTSFWVLAPDWLSRLIIPLIGLYFWQVITTAPDAVMLQLRLGFLLASAVALIAFYLHMLTVDGALAAFWLGTIVFGLGGLSWAVPLLTFFFTSSLLSKIGKQRKQQFDLIFEKSSRRDRGQVVANGGLAGLMVLIGFNVPDVSFYLAFLGVLAAVTADTWSTEIGVLASQKPRLITTLQPVESGTSGGITLMGSLGGVLGAAIIALSGWLELAQTLPDNLMSAMIIVIGSGFFGNVLDSLLGATWQAQYRCPHCQKITEKQVHCQQTPTSLISGFIWLTNDRVNVACAVAGGAVAWLLARALY